MNADREYDEPNETWLSSTIAGALLGIFIALCACLPLIAPYGIHDLFSGIAK